MLKQTTPIKESHVKMFIPGIVWFFLILVLMCLPSADIPDLGSWFDKMYFEKWGHCGMFRVLTFSFIYPVTKLTLNQKVKRKTALKIAIGACLWGLTTEFIQKFLISERSFDLLDWAADSLGVIIVYIFCRMKFLNFK